ncbi:MAG: hypothetical protein HQL67_09330 [Magnetococcales bacterium]|nr:hypothetical protein [Magnetococcales bacterium]
MRRSLPFSLRSPEQVEGDERGVVLALSRVEAELEQVSERHTRLLLRVQKQEKSVADKLTQLSDRQAATLRFLTAQEAEINEKIARIAQMQEQLAKRLDSSR